MATIREVAHKAGVSPSTVSLVLHERANVSAETKDIVDRAMRELGYERRRTGRPRGAFSASGRRRKGQIAFFAHLDSHGFYTSLPYLSAFHGIELAAARYNQSVTLHYVPNQAELPVDLLPKLSGAIVLSADLALPANLPHVRIMGGTIPTETNDHITYENDRIGVLAAEYLLGRGHRRCAFLSPHAGIIPNVQTNAEDVFATRGRTFEQTICAAGGTVRANGWSVPGWLAYSPVEMAEILKELLLKEPRPTGLFIPSDSLTGPAYSLMRTAGIRPGVDVDVVSCNNEVQVLTGLTPRPATVDIHTEVIGLKAIHQLMWRIENPNLPPVISLIRPTLLPSPEEFKGVTA